ncbi:MAG TPA: SDR family oxidoreductase [Streptosporangiaceae bacterium]|nr:SDR family oxidoreductase [Streptosporangiaceae bacterium]
MDSFAGKTVLITGASEGIGRALALALAAQGAHLALNARNAARLEESARQCATRGAQVLALPGDVSRQADCTMLATRTVQRFGRLDALVNNAGITMWSRFDAVTDFSVFERLLAVNYLAAVYLTAAALAHLKESRGLIVAVASLAGLTGVPERTGYAASKHAVFGLFDSLRIELDGTGVSITMVAPYFVASEIRRRATGPDGRPVGTSPLKEDELMTAEECAELTVRGMERRQRLVITNWRGHFGRLVRIFAPGLVDRIALKAVRDGR